MCDGAGYQGDIVVTLQLADKNSVCCEVFQHIRQMRPVWPGRGSCSSSPHKCHQTWNASMRLHPEALWSVPIDENSNLACHIILPDLSNWPIRAFFFFLFPCCGPAPQQNLSGPILSNSPTDTLPSLEELWGIISGPENLFRSAGLLGLGG